MWLWICLVILGLFLVFWFWLGPHLIRKNNLEKLFARIILAIIVADGFLTLISQSAGYWKNYSHCNEGSIIGKMFLKLHPLVFTLGLVFWVILATLLISKLAPLFSYILFFALSIGHFFGVKSWVKFDYFESTIYDEILRYLFYIFLALIFALILKKVRKK